MYISSLYQRPTLNCSAIALQLLMLWDGWQLCASTKANGAWRMRRNIHRNCESSGISSLCECQSLLPEEASRCDPIIAISISPLLFGNVRSRITYQVRDIHHKVKRMGWKTIGKKVVPRSAEANEAPKKLRNFSSNR